MSVHIHAPAGNPGTGRRFFAVLSAAGLVVLFAYIAGFALVWRHGDTRKDPGWTAERAESGTWTVTAVDPDLANALAPGDAVLAIEGKPVTGGFPYVPLLHAGPGSTYTMTVTRGDTTGDVRLDMRVERSSAYLWHPCFYLGIGFVLFLTGIAIGLFRADDRNARLLCLTWISLAMGLQSQGLYPLRDLFDTPSLLFFFGTQHMLFVAFCLGFTFYNQFPFGKPARGIWNILKFGLYAWAGAIVILLAGLQVFLLRGDPSAAIFGMTHVAFSRVYVPFYGFFIITVLFSMCAAVVNGYRRAKEPDERRRIRWVVYGSLAGILPFATSSLLSSNSAPGATSFAQYGLWHWLSVSMILSIPFTVTYAVVKHRLFDIRVVIRRGLQYLLAANALRFLILAQIFGLVAILAANSGRTVEEVFLQNTMPFVLLTLTVGSLWVHAPLRDWLDRRFFREAYDRERVLGELIDVVKELPLGDDVADLVGKTVESTLHPRSLSVFYLTRDRTRLVPARAFAPSVPPPPADAALITAMRDRGEALDMRSVRKLGLAKPLTGWLEAIEANLIVPMLGTEHQLAGLLVLGERRSEQPYTSSDRALLIAIAREMAFADETARLRESERRERDANRAKSVFLANMSHELRTPLNAILGFTQLMERTGGLTATHREYLGTITRSGEHLLGLINDVLSISKIEAGKVTLNEQPFDLHYLLKGIEEMFRLRAGDKGLNMMFSIDPNLPRFVSSDEGKLRQVLINLLGNAVKFTDEGGIALRCRWHADELFVEFEVEDTGPGIPESERASVFEPFGQTTTGRTSWEGTGLGLAISHTFVQVMGGEIDFTSDVGRGTTFRLSVPLGIAESPVTTPERRMVTGLAPGQPEIRLLVVDDKPENRTILTTLLTGVGFQTREAANGKQAVEAWEAWHPRLIWMDMRMPVMDGLEATKLIRKHEPGLGEQTTTKIIALTASAFEHDRAAILAAGCDDFVPKPYRESTIFEKLAEHLEVRFVYADAAGSSPAEPRDNAFSIQRLTAIPAQLRTELSQAISVGDLESARTVVGRIGELDHAVAARFQSLLRAYQLDEMQEALSAVEINRP